MNGYIYEITCGMCKSQNTLSCSFCKFNKPPYKRAEEKADRKEEMYNGNAVWSYL